MQFSFFGSLKTATLSSRVNNYISFISFCAGNTFHTESYFVVFISTYTNKGTRFYSVEDNGIIFLVTSIFATIL